MYAAPEAYAGQLFDPFLADCYSVGVTLFLLLTNSHCYEAPSHKDARFTTVWSGRAGIEKRLSTLDFLVGENVSLELVDFLARTICPERKRYSVAQLLHHPWITGAPSPAPAPFYPFFPGLAGDDASSTKSPLCPPSASTSASSSSSSSSALSRAGRTALQPAAASSQQQPQQQTSGNSNGVSNRARLASYRPESPSPLRQARRSPSPPPIALEFEHVSSPPLAASTSSSMLSGSCSSLGSFRGSVTSCSDLASSVGSIGSCSSSFMSDSPRDESVFLFANSPQMQLRTLERPRPIRRLAAAASAVLGSPNRGEGGTAERRAMDTAEQARINTGVVTPASIVDFPSRPRSR